MELSIKLRKQFESTLTPEQLAKYKALAFENISHFSLDDPLILHEIGASDQQKSAMQRPNTSIRQTGCN